MVALQRTESAYSDFKMYKTFGALIKDYRQWRQQTQESFSELLGISIRELQYWEKGTRNVHIGNLHDFSETTGIPMQVCVALNADQPIWYSLQKRIFAYSLLEVSQLRVNNVLAEDKDDRDGIYTHDKQITTDKHISLILSCHQQIHGTNKTLSKDIIRTASKILPDLNRIVFDSWGHYVGHVVCLPIKKDIYNKLKHQRNFAVNLISENVSNILELSEGVFFSYSTFAASISVAYPIMINAVLYQMKIQKKGNYLISFYRPSLEIKELFDRLDLHLKYKKAIDNTGHPDFGPTLYEIELDVLVRSLKPFLASLGYDYCD